MSTLLFSPTTQGMQNLKREGFVMDVVPPYSIDNPKVYHSGDVMYDNSIHFSSLSDKDSTLLQQLELDSEFILTTIHRNNNTDNPIKLSNFVGLETSCLEK